MEIKLRKTDDSIRVGNGDSLNDVFVDVNAIENDNDDYYNKALSISTGSIHKVFLLRKKGFIKLFVFRKGDIVKREDFGFFEDGEIVFEN